MAIRIRSLDIIKDIIQAWCQSRLWQLWTIVSVALVTIVAYAANENQEIPYVQYVLLVVFWAYPVGMFRSIRRLSFSVKMTAFLLAFLLAGATWYFFSFTTFYNGAKFSKAEEGLVLYNSVQSILSMDAPQAEKDKCIDDLLRHQIWQLGDGKIASRVGITILKNGKAYKSCPITEDYTRYYHVERIPYLVRFREKYPGGYPDDDDSKFVPFDDFTIGSNTYSFSYSYANRPYWSDGFSRAILFSINDWKSDTSFIRKKNYQRSYDFAIYFYCFFTALIFLFYYGEKQNKDKAELERRRKELEHKNQELKESNNKLERYKLVHNQLEKGIIKTTRYDPAQTLQNMEFSWRDFVEQELHSGGHSLRNEVTGRKASQEETVAFENHLYEAFIHPAVERIIKQLYATSDIITTEPAVYDTAELTELLIAHFQKDCLSDDLSRERLTITYARENLAGHHVNLNACRIESILDNLSYNTGQELDRVLEELDDCDDFEGYDAFHADVQLQFAVVLKDGADWYRIRYRDNVAGFPATIVNKIYHEPVPSSKEEGRKGEGTMYISLFVDLLNGQIEAYNREWPERPSGSDRKYAVTDIYIPLCQADEAGHASRKSSKTSAAV